MACLNPPPTTGIHKSSNNHWHEVSNNHGIHKFSNNHWYEVSNNHRLYFSKTTAGMNPPAICYLRINHKAQIFLTRPSVWSCVRHGCNHLERCPGERYTSEEVRREREISNEGIFPKNVRETCNKSRSQPNLAIHLQLLFWVYYSLIYCTLKPIEYWIGLEYTE